MSWRAEVVVQRIEERLDAIRESVPSINPPAAHWLDSNAGPSYCWHCVHIARGAEFDLGAPIKQAEWFERQDDWVEAFYDGIDGGFDTECDSTAACDICRRTLSYILTDYGVEDEIDYYRECPLAEVRDEDSYALGRLALNVWSGAKRSQILGVAVAVNQAWRLLNRAVSPC